MTRLLPEDLQNLSDELELFGLSPLPISPESSTFDQSELVLSMIDSLWKLMLMQRRSIQTINDNQAETLGRSGKQTKLESDLAELKSKLKSAESRLATAASRSAADRASAKSSEEVHLATLRENKLLHAHTEQLRRKHADRLRKRDEEIAALKMKMSDDGENALGPKQRVLSCSEREKILKQVVCKYVEANEKLTKRNIELTERLRSIDSLQFEQFLDSNPR